MSFDFAIDWTETERTRSRNWCGDGAAGSGCGSTRRFAFGFASPEGPLVRCPSEGRWFRKLVRGGRRPSMTLSAPCGELPHPD